MAADPTAAGPGGLSEEQAAVYDRQLRVWGVEAQRRLGASRILVAGLTGLAAEACKNVALAGVGALVLYDDGAPAVDAAPGNFLAASGLADAAGTADADALTVANATAATARSTITMADHRRSAPTSTNKPKPEPSAPRIEPTVLAK